MPTVVASRRKRSRMTRLRRSCLPRPSGYPANPRRASRLTGGGPARLSGPGAVALTFESAEDLLVVSDSGGNGFEAAAELVDLDGEARECGGVPRAEAVLVDEGAQVGLPVEGRAADPGACRHAREGHRPALRDQLRAGFLDPKRVVFGHVNRCLLGR